MQGMTKDGQMQGMAKEGPMQGMAKDGQMQGMAKEGQMQGMAKDGQMQGMAKPDDDHAKEPAQGMKGMAKPDDDHAKEPAQGMKGMAKKEDDHAEEKKEEEGGHGGGGVAEGLSVIAQGSAAEVDRMLAAKGIKVETVSSINMVEWGFETGNLTVKPGTLVRLKVRNTGNIPHEFMIMNGAAMNAVNYRLIRADWNLLEHEALTEVPFVMPGDGFDMVVEIHKPGMWMYMCMFPYHMQLGMMGMLMTPGMSGMGGMKM